MDKNQLANLLDEVATLLELKAGSNPFEVRAYQNAARSVTALDGDIEQLVREGKLKGVPGLGSTIIKRTRTPRAGQDTNNRRGQVIAESERRGKPEIILRARASLHRPIPRKRGAVPSPR